MKLKHDKLLSHFAFNFNPRHYNLVAAAAMEGGDFDDEFENPKVGLNSG